MNFAEVYFEALSGLIYGEDEVPVWQTSVPDDPDSAQPPDTYILFNQAEEDYIQSASNEDHRTRHLVQVHFVSIHPEAVRAIMRAARVKLRLAGIRPRYCAALMHEEDTGYWHLPMYTWYIDTDV